MAEHLELSRGLLEVLARHASAEMMTWFSAGVPHQSKAFARGVFFGYFAGAGRRARGAPFSLSAEEQARLLSAGLHAPAVWSLSDLARALLLLAACDALPAEQHLGLVREAYAKGDNLERIAVLRSLSLLPEAARFESVGAEACRSHVLSVFEAIACDNPFAARWFSELPFNQLVIKALFVGLSVARIVGLAKRKNAEVYRMAREYEAELRAAGRAVTQDTVFVAHALEETV